MAAVKPIESFGAGSQRALEEFHLNYNTALAAQQQVWAEEIADMIPGPSLKDSYPIAIEDTKWRELTGVNADAITTLVKEVTVVKRKFGQANKVELIRLKRGDFAYVQSWANKPAMMARGRAFLRNHLVADALAAGDSTEGFDGVNFFSASHPVNPFDAGITFRGSATWSNYVAAATPLDSANLTAQKQAMEQGVPGPDGEEIGLEADILLVPTSLKSTAYNLLSVQDVILSGVLAGGGDGVMGSVRNPHFESGQKMMRAPELPGTGATADWYLVSSTVLAMMMPPVLIAEEDLDRKEWGEDSDYFKDTDNIKIEERALLEVALLFPHGIRKMKGA